MYNSGSGYPPPGYPPATSYSPSTSSPSSSSSGGRAGGRGDQWSPGFSASSGYNSYGKREASSGYSSSSGMASKRSRVDDTPPSPSKTLHVRNLPFDTNDLDLRGLCSPFGSVEKVLILSGKKQGFVQMSDIATANAVLSYYETNQATIRSRPVYLQYSNRQEISSSGSSSRGSGEEPPNRILLVSVENLLYAITIDVIHQIFSKFGEVQKIILFNKSGFQALVQFSNLSSAVNARSALQNQNIYRGCCTLSIAFSSFPSITVKYNNDRTRDFTNPSLPHGPPSGGFGSSSPSGSYASPGMFGAAPGMYGGSLYGVPPPSPSAAAGPKVLICSNFNEEQITPDVIFTLFGVFGDVMRVKILYTKRDTALIQFRDHDQASTALNHLRHGVVLWGRELKVNFSKHSEISVPREINDTGGTVFTKDFSRDPRHRYKHAGSKNFQHICPVSKTLHLSNVSSTASESQLVSMFTTYGRVTAFKFFENNRRMALIEMSSSEESILALIGLHCTEMDEGELRISFSKSTISHGHPSASVYVGRRKMDAGAPGDDIGVSSSTATESVGDAMTANDRLIEEGRGDDGTSSVTMDSPTARDDILDVGKSAARASSPVEVEEEEML